MKIFYTFFILFLGLSGQAWGQLTCSNCTVTSAGGVVVGSATPAENPITVPVSSDNIFAGSIQLNGTCEFKITGTGNYILSGRITGSGPLTYLAPDAGSYGNEAGFTLTGSTANEYTGQTIITGGYVICNKPNALAVPHDLKIPAAAGGVSAHLWCLADNQLGTAVVDFSNAQSLSVFHLNNTTQTIAGIISNTSNGVVDNREESHLPAVITTGQPANGQAILNIAGTSTSCVFGGGSYIRRGSTTRSLTVNVSGGTQIIRDPDDHFTNVTFTSAGEGILEFNTGTTGNFTLGGGLTFGGNGLIKKTGAGAIVVDGATYLKTGGKIWLSEGEWRNTGTGIYANATQSNQAMLQVDALNANNSAFDMGGSHSIFGGLTGGGQVQNNFGRNEGYSHFTINQNNTTPAIFDGVIRDNSTNGEVNGGGAGKGGIHLKKEGSGIQVLTGTNLYTGSTTVSAGTLKLEGSGQLGLMNAGTYTATYGGALEISNASEEASQVTFEHNGTQAQVFTGTMTNSGDGTVKGKFLQSGSGKSIINGATPKSFTGQVSITNGFLGGSGDLRNAAGVTVGELGSIGGGFNEALKGDTLTVSNLTFVSTTDAASKLIVASTTPHHRSGLVKVLGTISAATGFTVDIAGTGLGSGYIIKCSNVTGLPLPTTGVNNTGKTVRFTWDSNGLWMQLSSGITLSVNSSCPRGNSPNNPDIRIEATYTDPSNLPPQGGVTDYFSLSNAGAKIGDLVISRTGHTILATFTGDNPTDADLPYTITYDDHRNPAVSFNAVIHPKPVIGPSNPSVCSDTSTTLTANRDPAASSATSLAWAINPASTEASLQDVNATDREVRFTAGTVTTPKSVTVEYTDYAGCKGTTTVAITMGLTLTFTSLTPICSGVETHVSLISSYPNTGYTWTVNANNVSAQSQPTSLSSPFIKQMLTNNGNSSETVTYSVTGTSGNCTVMASIPIEVSRLQAATATVTGGGEYCVNPENNTFRTNLIPSSPATHVEWFFTSSFPEGQANVISGNTQQAAKGALPAVNNDLVLSGNAPAWVYYVFRPYAGCMGTPSDTVRVQLHPAPVAVVNESSSVCSSSEAHPTRANIVVSSATTGVVYTWTVDRTNSPEVSGFSESSSAGAVVSTTNPYGAGSSVEEALLLSTTASSAQTITYRITPWHNGCPGRIVSTHVVVTPLPVVTPPVDRQHCPGATVEAESLTGTHGANSFTWTGGSSAGLPDQTVYGSGLPGYTASDANPTGPLQVRISAKNANGCESASAATFNLSVPAKPSIVLGTSRTLCSGPTVETAATANIEITSPGFSGTKYRWRAAFEENRTSGSSEIKIVENNVLRPLPFEENTLQEGNILQKITASAGSEARIIFTVRPSLAGCTGDEVNREIQVMGLNVTEGILNHAPAICSGSAANIRVGNSGDENTYSWTITNNTNNVMGYRTQTEGRYGTTISDLLSLKNNKRGSITYTITTSRENCVGVSVSRTVFVNPVPRITVLPSAAAICTGEKTAINLSVNLRAPESNGLTYGWQVNNHAVGGTAGTGSQFEQQTLTNQGETDATVTYTFTPRSNTGDEAVSCAGTPAVSAYTVVRRRVVPGISTPPEKVCRGDKITMEATPKGALAYQWLKDNVAIQEATHASFEVPTGLNSSSSYAIRITNACGSTDSDSRKVEVTSDSYFTGKTEAKTNVTVASVGEVVNFTYDGEVLDKVEYLWNFNDYTFRFTVRNTVHTYSRAGIYNPTLKINKSHQPECNKTITLPALTIKDASLMGDPNSSAGLSVFPIPAQDRFTIVADDDLQNITISDLSGKAIISQAVSGRKVTMSVVNLVNGIYLLIVTDVKGVRHLKMAKN